MAEEAGIAESLMGGGLGLPSLSASSGATGGLAKSGENVFQTGEFNVGSGAGGIDPVILIGGGVLLWMLLNKKRKK